MDNPVDRIVPLDQLDDYRIAEGDPDVRGWDVLSSDGRRVGEVDNLLVDTGAMKVRYLDVEMDLEFTEGGRGRHILIPIGYARLDRTGDRITVESLDSARLNMIPDYDHQPLTSEYETSLRSHFMGGSDRGSEFLDEERGTGGFYGQSLQEEDHIVRSEEELDVARQSHQLGELRVDKHVETQHVRERVPVHHDEVTIEHRPVDRMEGSGRITEDEHIRIPVSEEELVVNKRVVPKEEIIVKKQDRVDTQDIEADLRRERVDIDREGDFDVRER